MAETLRLPALQRGLFETVESESNNKSKNLVPVTRLPETSTFYSLPARAGELRTRLGSWCGEAGVKGAVVWRSAEAPIGNRATPLPLFLEA